MPGKNRAVRSWLLPWSHIILASAQKKANDVIQNSSPPDKKPRVLLADFLQPAVRTLVRNTARVFIEDQEQEENRLTHS